MVTQELVPIDVGPPPTLYGTANPNMIIEQATAQAHALAAVIKSRRLYTTISGREHVLVEGWTLLGTLLGVFPVCEWTRPLADGNGWEARVEAKTLDGRTVGAAEAQCTREEKTWSTRDDYALRSMAQTRATGKCLRIPLGFVMSLAGYDPTPAEEMPHEVIEGQARRMAEARTTTVSHHRDTDGTKLATTNQKNALIAIGKKMGWDVVKTQAEVSEFTKMKWDELTAARASVAIEAFDRTAAGE